MEHDKGEIRAEILLRNSRVWEEQGIVKPRDQLPRTQRIERRGAIIRVCAAPLLEVIPFSCRQRASMGDSEMAPRGPVGNYFRLADYTSRIHVT